MLRTRKEFRKRDLYASFGRIEKKGIGFTDVVLSIQRLKSCFDYLFWLETRLFFEDGPMTLVHFIDWVGAK